MLELHTKLQHEGWTCRVLERGRGRKAASKDDEMKLVDYKPRPLEDMVVAGGPSLFPEALLCGLVEGG